MNWNALKRGSMGRSEQLWITVLVGAVDDAGFSDAGPIDHAAVDALVASDAPMNDAAADDDAAVDATITDDAP